MSARRVALLGVACAAILAIATPASAQTASSVPTSAIASTRLPKAAPLYDVQLWPEQASSSIIVQAVLTTGTPLPVRVRIPVPEGATIDWIGEILGQTAAEDIASTYRFVDGGKMVEMVLTESHVAQYEATYLVPQPREDLLVAKLDWTQTTPASLVRFAAMVPAALNDVTVTPVSKYAPKFNESGDRLYVLDERKMKTGDEYSFTVSFSSGSGAPAQQGRSWSGRSTLLAILVAAIALVAVALFVVLRRQATAGR